MYQLIVLSTILLYFVRQGLADSSPTTQAPCLVRPAWRIAPQIGYLPLISANDEIPLIGGQTKYCDTVYNFLDHLIETPSLAQQYTLAALKIPGLQFYLCEAGNQVGQIGATHNANYHGGLRRVYIADATLTGDPLKLQHAIQHELFHAACHARQLLAKNTSTHSRQAFVDNKQKAELEECLAEGLNQLRAFIKQPTETKSILALKGKVVPLEKNYAYVAVLAEYPDPVFRAALWALLILQKDERVTQHSPDDQLSEKLAYLLSEVPDPVLQYFFPKLCQHITQFSLEIQHKAAYIPHLNTTGMHLDYSCNPRHDTYIAWFNRNHWDLSECQMLFSLVEETTTNDKKEFYPYATEALLRLIQTGILSDKKQKSEKAQADLYLGRLYYLDGDFKNACTYYKRAEKLGATFNPDIDARYYAEASETTGLRVQKLR